MIDRTRLEQLLGSLIRTRGTALHLFPGRSPFMRLKGRIVEASEDALEAQVIQDLARELLFDDHRNALERGEPVEVLYTTENGERFRVLVTRVVGGMALTFLAVASETPDFASAGLPEILGELSGFRRGLVLLSGGFGSGKPATLAALVDRINRTRPVHVVTIERRIDFVHMADCAVVHQRQLGSHVSTIAEGIRQAFVQGADVIAIGELEDLDGLHAVLEAVERGLLVMATVDTRSVVAAIGGLERLAAPEDRPALRRRIAGAFLAGVGQTLLPARHGDGQVPAFEILVRNESATRAIRDGDARALLDVMERGRGLGLRSRDQSLRELVEWRLIRPEDAAAHAVDREWVLSGPRSRD